jgi:uncharacterized protein YigE (DUF2233 family)
LRTCARAGSALVFLSFFLPAASGDWAIESLERQPGPGGAIEYRHYSLGETASTRKADVRLALFSTKNATLQVIDQPNFDHQLADTMARENCLAGVNGGYFDPEGKPVGLLRSSGKTIAPFRRARLLSGVLAARPEGVEIFRAREFPTSRNWPEAVQCGPFLVERGKPVAGLDDVHSAPRTFVLTTNDRRAAIGYCEPITLASLARILAALSQLKVSRALNLDGGSSSAFWCRTTGETISVSELKPVRDFIAIIPRPAR